MTFYRSFFVFLSINGSVESVKIIRFDDWAPCFFDQKIKQCGQVVKTYCLALFFSVMLVASQFALQKFMAAVQLNTMVQSIKV